MKEQLNNLYRLFISVFIILTIQGCGSDTPDPRDSYAISTSINSISFNNEFLQTSEQTFSIDVTYSGEGLVLGFAPDAPIVPWLTFSTENVTDTTATIIVELTNEDNYLADLYQTTLRVSAGNATTAALVHQDIDVSLLIWEKLNFSADLNDESVTSQSFDLSIDTANWTIASDVDWLSLTTETIEGITTITVTPTITEFTQGQLANGNITITENKTGDVDTIPVDLGIDDIRLFASHAALTFNNQLNRTQLSHTIDILTNHNEMSNWQATTDANWLTLTPDSVNNQLTLTADADQISNGLHFAKVTIAATDNAAMQSGIINVSFNKGDFDNSLQSELIIENVDTDNNLIAVDPLRPYIYVGHDNAINIYNLVTGEAVNTIASPYAEQMLVNLIVHPDGSQLIAVSEETSTDTQQFNYFNLNLSDLSVTEYDSELVDITYQPHSIVMVEGKAVVITQALELANLALERQFWDSENAFLIRNLNQVATTDSIITINTANELVEVNLSYNDYANVSATSSIGLKYSNENFNAGLTSVATNSDATELYTNITSAEWLSFDGSDFTNNGELPADVETLTSVQVITDTADNSYFYRYSFIDGYGAAFSLTKYDSNQQQVNFAAYTAGAGTVCIIPNYHRLLHYDGEKIVIDYIQQ